MASLQDYIKLHFLVFLWGFTAILGKLISIPAMEMVFYRTVLAAGGIQVQVPEAEAADAKEFLASPVTPLE